MSQPKIDKAITIHSCNSWEDFIVAVRKTINKRIGRRVYRGQRDPAWLLSSIFERSIFHMKAGDPNADLTKTIETASGLWKIREGYVERFSEYARALPGLPGLMSPEDWWILGRHHGLVTPLLDWSESPYVAAFFALTDYMEALNPGFKLGMPTGGIKWGGEGSITIWELVETEGMENGDFSIIRPETEFSVHSLRIRAQKSVFTKLIHNVHLDLESYLQSRDLISCLERYDIPGVEAAKALRDLDLMSITFSDLFPDLGGAAARANFGASGWHLVGGIL